MEGDSVPEQDLARRRRRRTDCPTAAAPALVRFFIDVVGLSSSYGPLLGEEERWRIPALLEVKKEQRESTSLGGLCVRATTKHCIFAFGALSRHGCCTRAAERPRNSLELWQTFLSVVVQIEPLLFFYIVNTQSWDGLRPTRLEKFRIDSDTVHKQIL